MNDMSRADQIKILETHQILNLSRAVLRLAAVVREGANTHTGLEKDLLDIKSTAGNIEDLIKKQIDSKP